MQDMAHLSITLNDEVYRRLKRDVPPKQISRFIEAAVRQSLRASTKELDAAYQAAAKESWRRELERDWDEIGLSDWPDK